jgi:hypothetical protein
MFNNPAAFKTAKTLPIRKEDFRTESESVRGKTVQARGPQVNKKKHNNSFSCGRPRLRGDSGDRGILIGAPDHDVKENLKKP